MNSQVEDLLRRGQKAGRLSEGANVSPSEVNYIFCSPESLQENRWISVIRNDNFRSSVCAVFVDEAHCVLQWGCGSSPFRSAYASIGNI